MDYEILKTADQYTRDNFLRQELSPEKCQILDKYQLRSNARLYWERYQSHYPVQEYFSHRFARKASSLGIIFHIYRLCYAKVKYFEKNWPEFAACVYSGQTGLFVETELYNMEYIKHLSTGIIIDLRNLARITKYEDFLLLCKHLEELKKSYLAGEGHIKFDLLG